MRTALSFIIVSLLSVFSAYSQNKPDVYKSIVKYLASDELAGREMGTEGEKLAGDFIATEFAKIGLEPKGEEGFFQEFSNKEKPHPHVTPEEMREVMPIMGRNVIGFLDNGAKTTIVVGAHYDHLGMGNHGSLHASKEKAIHNGADDNASGVAVMIQLAKTLSEKNITSNNFMFIAFSGEEKGLWGSKYYAENPTLDIEDLNFMINMDMVGRFEASKGLAIHGVGTSPIWVNTIEEIRPVALKVVLDSSGIGPSDHTSFYLQDMPVLHFFTGQHSDYHKPTDDFEKLNYKGMVLVHDVIYDIINSTLGKGEIEFLKTKSDKSNVPNFKVTLGVMPDYMYDGVGMRIDGVIEDRPAQKAGIERGDVVLQLGEYKVKNMQDYMVALSKIEKGDKVITTIKRDGKSIEKDVQF